MIDAAYSLLPHEALTKALVIDEEHDARNVLANAVSEAGYIPERYASPHDVLHERGVKAWGLAIINLELPHVDGFALARQLLESGAVEDLVFTSSKQDTSVVVRAMRMGAVDFLHKPFSDNELERVAARLERRLILSRRLRSTQRRHAELINNLPLLVFTLKPTFELEYINKASKLLLGFSPVEAIGAGSWFLERLHPDERVMIKEGLLQAFNQGTPFSVECRLIHRNGIEAHGILQTIPALACDGGECEPPLGLLEGVFVDISDRISLEKALVQDEKFKTLGAISAEMAHEVRNPLMSIAGFARRLQKKTPDMPEVGIILREALRLEKLLDRIRGYLQPVEAHGRALQINTLLVESVNKLYSEMNDKSVLCHLDLSEELPNVFADEEIVRNVCLALLRVTLLSVEENTVFHTKTFESNNSVHLEVSYPLRKDAPLNPSALFLPFDQDEAAYALAMCYRLVKSTHGLLSHSLDDGHVALTVSLPTNSSMDLARPPMQTHAAERSHKACFDEGTDSLSRELFQDVLMHQVRSASKSERSISVGIVGVKHLNAYTREHGPEKNAELMCAVADAIQSVLGKPWRILARYRKNRFSLLLPDMEADALAALVQEMRTAVDRKKLPLAIPEHTNEKCANIIIGVATCIPTPHTQPPALINAAERAFLRACEEDGDDQSEYCSGEEPQD